MVALTASKILKIEKRSLLPGHPVPNYALRFNRTVVFLISQLNKVHFRNTKLIENFLNITSDYIKFCQKKINKNAKYFFKIPKNRNFVDFEKFSQICLTVWLSELISQISCWLFNSKQNSKIFTRFFFWSMEFDSETTFLVERDVSGSERQGWKPLLSRRPRNCILIVKGRSPDSKTLCYFKNQKLLTFRRYKSILNHCKYIELLGRNS